MKDHRSKTAAEGECPGAASPHPEVGVRVLGGRWSEGAQTRSLSKGTYLEHVLDRSTRCARTTSSSDPEESRPSLGVICSVPDAEPGPMESP